MKLNPSKQYTKTGTTINSYKATLKKVEVEKHNLQDKEFEVEYYEDRIILIVK